MSRLTHRHASGFTLTELAIVLAVVGVLAAGLWNLMSGANTQVRDQSVATQQEELISAVKTFLASNDGQSFMASNPACGGTCGPLTNFSLPLPAIAAGVAGCTTSLSPGSMTAMQNATWCSDLPPGFSTGTTNAYGQTYGIKVLRDATLNPSGATPPNTYSFMIMTSGGNTITDMSGARIASLIGGDGGFIYTANVCGGPPIGNFACGAYNGWSTPVTAYGFAAGTSGTVASRTYVSPQQNMFTEWLARVQLPGDSIFTYNTMTVPEYLGGNALVMGSYPAAGAPVPDQGNNDFYMGSFATPVPATGGGTFNLQAGVFNFLYNPPVAPGAVLGTMNMQGGTINVQTGTINMGTAGSTTGGGTINLDGGEITSDANTASILLMINPDVSLGVNTSPNPLVDLQSGCKQTSPGVPAGCNPALQITGDANVSNLLNANALYANTFIYQSSDIRLKKNIRPLQNSLADIMRLKPVSFAFKANDKEGIGVIAQDIEKVYPQLVSEGDFKSVNYEGLIGPLIGAVQELKRDNDDLRRQIQDQAAREHALEQELKAAHPAAN